jgi:hypothetical protein
LHYVFAALSAEDFEAALTQWMLDQGVTDIQERAWTLAVDGKTLRGSGGALLPGVHLLAAYAPEVQGVLAQLQVPADTNEHKALLELLRLIPLQGTLITGDAIFLHRDVCRAIHDGGGDYFLVVKDNQETLKNDIQAAFRQPFSPLGTTAAGSGSARSPDDG